jgi:hypothetical protein
MNKKKTLELLLLDLSAFAYSQSDDERSRRDFEGACDLVEKDSPFDALIYRAHISSLTREVEEEGRGQAEDRTHLPLVQSTADTRA